MTHRDPKPANLETVVVQDDQGELEYTVPIAPEPRRGYRRGDIAQRARRRRR